MIDRPRIVLGPHAPPVIAEAVNEAGGRLVAPGEAADGLVWSGFDHDDDAGSALAADGIVWVQLPGAGIERYVEQGYVNDHRTWTCAKGAFAEPVAEHALALTLAGLRHLPERVRATSWGEPKATMLYDLHVTVIGGGGIASEFIRLIEPFRCHVTVVRRSPEPHPAAERTLGIDQLDVALTTADVVLVATALTDETRGLIGAAQLRLMKRTAWLINIARGGVVVTDDLVAALDAGQIAGAGLDVTDPEPLPPGHPLWGRDDCLITPHTADTPEMTSRLLAERVYENVLALRSGAPLVGVVDQHKKY
ncbi:D-isomer specific 2-hydroxyacid dehydrogenase family protein [Pseudactinotalea sp.]|uniref:D-isomer specific 2-hydroxyacid dehydrogenase family protein n=1 Tax=Pseudactinotalea sp. TaxID=1926260 RepID=UPI003B3A6DC7